MANGMYIEYSAGWVIELHLPSSRIEITVLDFRVEFRGVSQVVCQAICQDLGGCNPFLEHLFIAKSLCLRLLDFWALLFQLPDLLIHFYKLSSQWFGPMYGDSINLHTFSLSDHVKHLYNTPQVT